MRKPAMIFLDSLLYDRGCSLGIRAHDDFDRRVDYRGRNIGSVVLALLDVQDMNKYRYIVPQLVEQLRRHRYVQTILFTLCRATAVDKHTTFRAVMDTGAIFNFAESFVKQELCSMAENGYISGVEFQAGLDNIYL